MRIREDGVLFQEYKRRDRTYKTMQPQRYICARVVPNGSSGHPGFTDNRHDRESSGIIASQQGKASYYMGYCKRFKKSGITLFWLDAGVDSGPIWAQEEFEIDIEDDAASVYRKVKDLSVKMLKKNIPNIERGIILKKEQDHTKATYWRKRERKDGEIDWRMSSKRIYDLVRSLTRPYPGAESLYRGKATKIWKVALTNAFRESDLLINMEPGKIISLSDQTILVKTGNGLIDVIEHELDPLPVKGEYL